MRAGSRNSITKKLKGGQFSLAPLFTHSSLGYCTDGTLFSNIKRMDEDMQLFGCDRNEAVMDIELELECERR